MLLGDPSANLQTIALPVLMRFEVRDAGEPPSLEAVWKWCNMAGPITRCTCTEGPARRHPFQHFARPLAQELAPKASAWSAASQVSCSPSAWEARFFSSEAAGKV